MSRVDEVPTWVLRSWAWLCAAMALATLGVLVDTLAHGGWVRASAQAFNIWMWGVWGFAGTWRRVEERRVLTR